MNSFVKGASLASLVFSVGIGAGFLFLRQYHKDKVSEAKIEGIEEFINSGSAARYVNGDTLKNEYSLGELSPDENWEVIIRRTPCKKSQGDAE